MKINADYDYIIAKPYKLKEENTNGLLIKNTDTDCLAKVISFGRCWGENIYKNKIGSIIIYDTDKAKKYTINGEQYLILKDIIGFIKEDENQ